MGNAIVDPVRQQAHDKAKRRPGKAVFMRREQRPGWTAPLKVYAIFCPRCRKITETHAAGYGRVECNVRNPDGSLCARGDRVMTKERFRDKTLLGFLLYGLTWPIRKLLGLAPRREPVTFPPHTTKISLPKPRSRGDQKLN